MASGDQTQNGNINPDLNLNLKQTARALGLHYTTVYRYVRQGRLAAEREGTEWRVSADAVEDFLQARRNPAAQRKTPTASETTPWADRLAPPLRKGDEPAAWRVIGHALDAGHDLAYCYLDMIAPALSRIDIECAEDDRLAHHPVLATVVAQRLVSRLGPQFRRPGRTRGTVILGGPTGEHHQLPLSMIADLVRGHGFGVLELGTNVLAETFAAATVSANRLVAIGLGVTTVEHLAAVQTTVEALRRASPQTPIVIGGQAVRNPHVADLLDADGWASDGRQAVEVITDLAERGRHTSHSSQASHSSQTSDSSHSWPSPAPSNRPAS